MTNRNKSRGRPSRYRPEYVEKARTLAEFGATQEEIAQFFDVHPDTLRVWAAKDAALADAIKTGAARADERVANGLYRRAVGFEYEEEVALSTPQGVQKTTVKRVAHSDTRAAALWLANRTNFSLNPRGRNRQVDLGTLDGSARSVTQASFKILEAVSSGALTSEEAASAASILAIAAKALKTSELEERLDRLEHPTRPVPAQIAYDGDNDNDDV